MASIICQALCRGVTRSKQTAMRWRRKAAEKGSTHVCSTLAACMYADHPYAREVGRVGEAAGTTTSAEVMEGHDVPPEVLTDVVHWLRKAGHDPVLKLEVYRRRAQEGDQYCYNNGCEVVGQLKKFKVCPQCKTARYCGDACQKQDWTAGGHQVKCGTLMAKCGTDDDEVISSRSAGRRSCDKSLHGIAETQSEHR